MVSRRLWFPDEELKADRVAQAQKMMGDAFKGAKDAAAEAQKKVQEQFEQDRIAWAQKQMEQAFSGLRTPPTPQPMPEPEPEPTPPPAPEATPPAAPMSTDVSTSSPSMGAPEPSTPSMGQVHFGPTPGVDVPEDESFGPAKSPPPGMDNLFQPKPLEGFGPKSPTPLGPASTTPNPGAMQPMGLKDNLGRAKELLGDAFQGIRDNVGGAASDLGTKVNDIGFRAPGQDDKGILGNTGLGQGVRAANQWGQDAMPTPKSLSQPTGLFGEQGPMAKALDPDVGNDPNLAGLKLGLETSGLPSQAKGAVSTGRNFLESLDKIGVGEDKWKQGDRLGGAADVGMGIVGAATPQFTYIGNVAEERAKELGYDDDKAETIGAVVGFLTPGGGAEQLGKAGAYAQRALGAESALGRAGGVAERFARSTGNIGESAEELAKLGRFRSLAPAAAMGVAAPIGGVMGARAAAEKDGASAGDIALGGIGGAFKAADIAGGFSEMGLGAGAKGISTLKGLPGTARRVGEALRDGSGMDTVNNLIAYHGTADTFKRPRPGGGIFGNAHYVSSTPRGAELFAADRAADPFNNAVHDLRNYEDELAKLGQRTDLSPEDRASEEEWIRDAMVKAQEVVDQGHRGDPDVIGPLAPQIRPTDIPDDMRFFDLNEPLDKNEAANILAIIAGGGGRKRGPVSPETLAKLDTMPTRAAFYEALTDPGGTRSTQKVHDHANNVNRALRQLGYEGVKYQGERSAQVTDNEGGFEPYDEYAIFPDSMQRIKNALTQKPFGIRAGQDGVSRREAQDDGELLGNGRMREVRGNLDGLLSRDATSVDGRPPITRGLKLDAAGEVIGGLAGAQIASQGPLADQMIDDENDPNARLKRAGLGAAGFLMGSQAGGKLRRNAGTLQRVAEAFRSGQEPGPAGRRIIPSTVAKGLAVSPRVGELPAKFNRGFLPNRMDILHSIRNTAGAILHPDGTLEVDLERFQKPKNEGRDVGRGGVYYAGRKGGAEAYRAGEGTTTESAKTMAEGGDKMYGPEKTAYRNVLFVDETGTMGRDIATAFLGKDRYEKVYQKLMGLMKSDDPVSRQEAIRMFGLMGYDKPGSAEAAVDGLRDQARRYSIDFALPEAMASGMGRKAGYEAAIGVERGEVDGSGTRRPFIGEVFEWRESHYPGAQATGSDAYRIGEQYRGKEAPPVVGPTVDPALKQIARAQSEGRVPQGSGRQEDRDLWDNETLKSLGLTPQQYKKLTHQGKQRLDSYLFDPESADRGLSAQDAVATAQREKGHPTYRWSAYQQSESYTPKAEEVTTGEVVHVTDKVGYMDKQSGHPAGTIFQNSHNGSYYVKPSSGDVYKPETYYSIEEATQASDAIKATGSVVNVDGGIGAVKAADKTGSYPVGTIYHDPSTKNYYVIDPESPNYPHSYSTLANAQKQSSALANTYGVSSNAAPASGKIDTYKTPGTPEGDAYLAAKAEGKSEDDAMEAAAQALFGASPHQKPYTAGAAAATKYDNDTDGIPPGGYWGKQMDEQGVEPSEVKHAIVENLPEPDQEYLVLVQPAGVIKAFPPSGGITYNANTHQYLVKNDQIKKGDDDGYTPASEDGYDDDVSSVKDELGFPTYEEAYQQLKEWGKDYPKIAQQMDEHFKKWNVSDTNDPHNAQIEADIKQVTSETHQKFGQPDPYAGDDLLGDDATDVDDLPALPGNFKFVDAMDGLENWDAHETGTVFHGKDENTGDPFFYVKTGDGPNDLQLAPTLLHAQKLSNTALESIGYKPEPGLEALVTGVISKDEDAGEMVEGMDPGEIYYTEFTKQYVVKTNDDDIMAFDTYLDAVSALHDTNTEPYAFDPDYLAQKKELQAKLAAEEKLPGHEEYVTGEVPEDGNIDAMKPGDIWYDPVEENYMSLAKTGGAAVHSTYDEAQAHLFDTDTAPLGYMNAHPNEPNTATMPLFNKVIQPSDTAGGMLSQTPDTGGVAYNVDDSKYEVIDVKTGELKQYETYDEAETFVADNVKGTEHEAAMDAVYTKWEADQNTAATLNAGQNPFLKDDDNLADYVPDTGSAPIHDVNVDSVQMFQQEVMPHDPIGTVAKMEGTDYHFIKVTDDTFKTAATAQEAEAYKAEALKNLPVEKPSLAQKLKAGAKALFNDDAGILGVRKRGGDEADRGPFGAAPARTPEEIHAEQETLRRAKPSKASLRQQEKVAEAAAVNEQGGTGQGATNPTVRATGKNSPGNLPKIRQERGNPAGGPHTPGWDEATMGTRPTSEFDDAKTPIPPVEALAARAQPITMADAQAIMKRQAADVRRTALALEKVRAALPADNPGLAYLTQDLEAKQAALPAQQQAVRELAESNARAQGETAVGLATNVKREVNRVSRRKVNRAAQAAEDEAIVMRGGRPAEGSTDVAGAAGGETRAVDADGRVIASRGPEEVDLDGNPVTATPVPVRRATPNGPPLTPEGGVAPGGVVEPGGTVEAGGTVGAGATVKAGATVEEGATVQKGAIIRPGATAAPGMLRAPVHKVTTVTTPATPGVPAITTTTGSVSPAPTAPGTPTPRVRKPRTPKATTTTTTTATPNPPTPRGPRTPRTPKTTTTPTPPTPTPPTPTPPTPSPEMADTGWFDQRGKLKPLAQLEATIRKEVEGDLNSWRKMKADLKAAGGNQVTEAKITADYNQAVDKMKATRVARITGLPEDQVLDLASREVWVRDLMDKATAYNSAGANPDYSVHDTVTNIARANLIGANPVTMARNALGGIASAVWHPIEAAIASTVDPVVGWQYARKGLDTTYDRRYGKEAAHVMNGYYRALPAALINMGAAMKRGQTYTAEGLQEASLNEAKGGAGHTKASRWVTDQVLKPLTATDAFFRTLTQGGEVMRQSYRQMKARGMSDADIKANHIRLLQGPRTEYVKAMSELDAGDLAKGVQEQVKYRAFGQGLKDEDWFGRTLQGVQSFRPGGVPIGPLVMPFVTTPYNAAKFDLERSPAGLGKAILELATVSGKKPVVTAGARGINARMKETAPTRGEMSDRLARGFAGSALFAGLIWGATTGALDINGALPESQDERDEWEADGRKPYTIGLPDPINRNKRYVSFQDVPGLNAALMSAAVIKDMRNGYGNPEKDEAAVITQGILESIRSLAAQPMASGVLEVAGAIGRPGQSAAKLGLGMLGPILPAGGAIRTVTTAMDPVQREQPSTIGEAVSAPYIRGNLPVKRTAFGQAMGNQNAGLPGVVNPLRTSAAAEFRSPTRYVGSKGASTDVAIGRAKAKVDAWKANPALPMPSTDDLIKAQLASTTKDPFTEWQRGDTSKRVASEAARTKSKTMEDWLKEPVREWR